MTTFDFGFGLVEAARHINPDGNRGTVFLDNGKEASSCL